MPRCVIALGIAEAHKLATREMARSPRWRLYTLVFWKGAITPWLLCGAIGLH